MCYVLRVVVHVAREDVRVPQLSLSYFPLILSCLPLFLVFSSFLLPFNLLLVDTLPLCVLYACAGRKSRLGRTGQYGTKTPVSLLPAHCSTVYCDGNTNLYTSFCAVSVQCWSLCYTSFSFLEDAFLSLENGVFSTFLVWF